ncbi:potassium channel protein [Altererythrobacter aerius]|uniref:Potassium channel protein n=2 Tax=Tsuneonella aeria TaxID=1837929 RepID=A0A6I4TB68_9SPHN|nr:potassium channel protein [Tsuneonella aeria]
MPMLALSIAWLAIVLIELASGGSALLETIGVAIWIVFLIEFAVRFALADGKLAFLRSNWLTVLALIVPALRMVRALAVLRAARALRGLRLVRIVGTANRSMNALRVSLRRRRVGYVLALTMTVALLGAGGMLSFEPAGEVSGGFESYPHALWWTGMLLASIGSDYWPVTLEGRILTMLLSLYGLAVFGYVTAIFASFFVGRDAQAPAGPIVGSMDLSALRTEIEALRRDLADRRGPQPSA